MANRRFTALVSGPHEARHTGLETALSEMALDLRSAAHAAPRAEFVDSLRMRLMAVAAVAPEPEPKATLAQWSVSWSPSARRSRLAVTLVAGAVVVGAAGVAGARSLPGQPFYDVKQASESIQMSFTHGDAARGALHLKFAARRLAELEKLTGTDATQLTAAGVSRSQSLAGLSAKKGSLKTIRDTLKAMDKETKAGASLLTSAFEVTKDRATMHTLGSFAQRQASRLQSVIGALPTQEQTTALDSLSLLLQVQGQAFVAAATAPLDANSQSTVTSAPTIVQTPSKVVKAITDKAHHATSALVGGLGGSQGSGSGAAASSSDSSGSDSSGSASGGSADAGTPSTPQQTPSTPTTVNVTVPLSLPPTCLDLTTAVGLPPVCIVPPATSSK